MDAAVMHASWRRAAGAVLVALLAVAAGTVHAQVGSDPTQPPALLAPKADGNDAPREQRLQAVIRGSHGSRSAVIGGQLVAVGDTISTEAGPARVAAIHDDRVVLVRGSARATLALHPSITSPVSAGATSNSSSPRRP